MPRPQTPTLAADAIIELVDLPGKPIVLIERKNPPPGWAIPGGFVDIGVVDAGCTVQAYAGPYSRQRRRVKSTLCFDHAVANGFFVSLMMATGLKTESTTKWSSAPRVSTGRYPRR